MTPDNAPSTARCAQFRESLSAQLDGEDAVLSVAAVQSHLARCAGCSSWHADVLAISGQLRLRGTAHIPDLSGPILQAAASRRRETPFVELLARAGLVAVGIAQAAMALIVLVRGVDPMMGTTHAAHESGAWNLALAIAFLTAAARPRAAAGLVPMVGVLTVVLVAVTVTDLSSGHVTAARGVSHLLMVAGLALLVSVAVSTGTGTGGSRAARRTEADSSVPNVPRLVAGGAARTR